LAQRQGAEVVALDMAQPFTAARGRNAGWHRALELLPDLRFVQFVDGDCEVVSGWLAAARSTLLESPLTAAVFGRRRERHPERSVYNRLCDIEWNVQPGQVKYCGGDVMFRADALAQVGGYREDLIAGEEPELCVRLRAREWTIRCIPVDMTVHDAAMTRFSQWWRRTVRSGYAYAEGVRLHGAPPERHWVKPLRSALLWGLCLPVATVLLATIAGPSAGLLLMAYPLQVLRLAYTTKGSTPTQFWRGLFLVLGKFPEAQGAMRYARLALLKQRAQLIEYK
jgi:hypothetical protein